jgi:hypothetical protein
VQITKELLDTPICELIEGVDNTETFRKFIRNSELFFCLDEQDIDNMPEDELNAYIEHLDYLWEK